MNIVLVSPTNLELETSNGIRAYLTNLIPQLTTRGVEVTLFGVGHGKEVVSKHNMNIIPITRSGTSGYRFSINLFFKAKKMRFPTNTIIHIQRPDYTLPFILFHKKKPRVCTLHGNVSKAIALKKGKLIGTIYNKLELFTMRGIDRIITVDENTKEFYVKKYPRLKDRFVVIPVGINTEQFKLIDKNQMRKKYMFEDEKIVIFVGRLEREKNLEFLLRSFKIVKEIVSNAKLVLVGDGRERKRLENLVKEKGLKDVIFLGTMDHDKIPEILSCADVFVLCSLYEAGPLVVQEALACGVPCVTTDVGRVREFIVNRLTGRIVKKRGDEKVFANCILEMLKEDPARVREACHTVSKNFSFEKTADQTIKVYKSLL